MCRLPVMLHHKGVNATGKQDFPEFNLPQQLHTTAVRPGSLVPRVLIIAKYTQKKEVFCLRFRRSHRGTRLRVDSKQTLVLL